MDYVFLTPGRDFVTGTNGDSTIVADWDTLTEGDRIDAGGGFDELYYEAAGNVTLDLNLLGSLSGIDEIHIGVSDRKWAVVGLRDDHVNVVRGEYLDEFHLYSSGISYSLSTGVDIISGSSTFDQFEVTRASDLGVDDRFDGGGGEDCFALWTDLILDFPAELFVSVERLHSDGTLIITSSDLEGIVTLSGRGVFQAKNASLDLRNVELMYASEPTLAARPAGGTNFLVDDVSMLPKITGGAGQDQITISGTVLSDIDRHRVLEGRSIEIISDDSGVYGGRGNNILGGSAGADRFYGGGGDDTYVINNQGDVVVETSSVGGVDTVKSSFTHSLGSHVENLVLTGSSSRDGTGNELANAITGNSGGNVLKGLAGSDTLDGAGGDDTLDGGAGLDTASYKSATGQVVVSLDIRVSQDTLGSERDVLVSIENVVGSRFDDTLTGNSGANQMNGGAGADLMIGGGGNDSYIVDNAGDGAREASDTGGIDTVYASVGYTVGANIERLVLTGGANINANGNSLANVLTGNGGANRLDGRAGADSLNGGAGDDTYYVDNAGDRVSETFDAGIDTLRSSVSYTIGANIENLILTGAAVRGTGNSLANTILGNASSNILDGDLGADTMSGGAGNDTYRADSVLDKAVEAAGAGTDTVQSSVSFTLGANVEALILTGAAVKGTGNVLENSLTGTSAANILDGGLEADTMRGGAGDDTYHVENAGDRAIEGANAGIDTVRSWVDYTLGNNVEHLTLAGAALRGTGNSLANMITGTSAANVLSGGSGDDMLGAGLGNDELRGGAGHDRLQGGAGADIFRFDSALSATLNVDEILDFTAAADSIGLDRTVFSGIPADGTLGAAAFQAGVAAQDADDRIIYDAATGNIYYDADGTGAAAAVLFATVTPGLVLTQADFVGYP